jgi:hypothetical protein
MRSVARGCLTFFDLNGRTGNTPLMSYPTAWRNYLWELDSSRRSVQAPELIRYETLRLESSLLDALLLSVPAHQGIENGEDVAPVFDHAIKNVAQFRIAFGVAVPLQEDRRRDFDIAAELLWRMAAQEEPIEKRRFPLGKGEVCGDFYGNDLGYRGHKEKCSLPKSVSASSGTVDWMSPAG